MSIVNALGVQRARIRSKALSKASLSYSQPCTQSYYLDPGIITTSSVSTPSPQEIQKKIISELSWPLKLHFLKYMGDKGSSSPTETAARAVGIEAFQLNVDGRKQGGVTELAVDNDDNSMKMKLFRLMYETVRDSDLKVKRAELIKMHYQNSSAFEIGYLLGDLTEKYNVMTDISLTLKRLYNEWKPIEHINAYEQIANEAIEISHIIELVRSASKKGNATAESKEPKH